MVVVRDTTHGFNSAQIGYLEGRLAQELRARPGVDVREGQIGQHQPRARRLRRFLPELLIAGVLKRSDR